MHAERTLETFGYDVVTANSGEDAVKLATETEAISLILMDINLGGEAEKTERMLKKIAAIFTATYEQFPGMFITRPSSEGRIKTQSGKEFLRIKFRIWPGRKTTLGRPLA